MISARHRRCCAGGDKERGGRDGNRSPMVYRTEPNRRAALVCRTRYATGRRRAARPPRRSRRRPPSTAATSRCGRTRPARGRQQQQHGKVVTAHGAPSGARQRQPVGSQHRQRRRCAPADRHGPDAGRQAPTEQLHGPRRRRQVSRRRSPRTCLRSRRLSSTNSPERPQARSGLFVEDQSLLLAVSKA